MRTRSPSRQTHLILEILLQDPLQWHHGYSLAKLAGLSSGTLYPILIRLNERALLDAKWLEPERPGRPGRHAYRLSTEGLAYARQSREQPETLTARTPEALA